MTATSQTSRDTPGIEGIAVIHHYSSQVVTHKQQEAGRHLIHRQHHVGLLPDEIHEGLLLAAGGHLEPCDLHRLVVRDHVHLHSRPNLVLQLLTTGIPIQTRDCKLLHWNRVETYVHCRTFAECV